MTGSSDDKALPQELKTLVSRTLAEFGRVIAELEGPAFFRKVEWYRALMIASRRPSRKAAALAKMRRRAEKETPATRLKLAHAFGLYLELVNCCESAYRTRRLREDGAAPVADARFAVTDVITAHPTESRAPETIAVLSRVTDDLIESLQGERVVGLRGRLRILWSLPLVRSRRPSVLDEAEHLFSILFAPELVDFYATAGRGERIAFHAWVGGDKDGHPGVDERVMVESFEASRRRLVALIVDKFERLHADLEIFPPSRFARERRAIRALQTGLRAVRTVRAGDGDRLFALRRRIRAFFAPADPIVAGHAAAEEIAAILSMFPALVCPLELREDAGVLAENLRRPGTISRMVATVARLSGKSGARAYVRGLILSHCETVEDLRHGMKLLSGFPAMRRIPVIPLFETRSALEGGARIAAGWLRLPGMRARVTRDWGGRLEIMLGYSDSSKETGALPSRFLIHEVLASLDRVIRGARLTPVFFHGSGGSIERGGGSLKDQLDWWPTSVLRNLKMTIQGEMVQRQLATPEILRSQIDQLARHAAARKKPRMMAASHRQVLTAFANAVSAEYEALVGGPRLRPLLDASPFNVLDRLTMGSRPTRRPSRDVSVNSLRAIPWVLCWTQTRLSLPTWWGLGTAWSRMDEAGRRALRSAFARDPFFRSFVKSLGFTLEKMDVEVWAMYARSSGLPPAIERDVRRELALVRRFFRELTGRRGPFAFQRWLAESIALRSSSIHLLNVLQIMALREGDTALLRETITGVACGMLTTG